MPFVVPATYVERLFSVENYQKSDSIKERCEVLTAALEIFINNPITGVGAGNYGFVYMRDYRESQVHIHVDYIRQQGSTYTDHSVGAHNMYAEVAAETGLFGLITLLTFIFSGIKMMYRLHRENILPEWKQLPLAIMLSIIGFAFAGIFLHGQLQKAIWIVTGFAVALSQMAKRQRALNAKTT
jgi:O-antigen ligase